jgi:capsular exopolysaccharide synthesis family protein
MNMKEKLHGGTKERKALHSILGRNVPFAYVEAFKTLRTNIDFVASTGNVKALMITSALPDESKSNTVVNLSLSMVSSGKSVVIVECDMRKPTLRQYLKLGRGNKGLSAYLSGNASLEDCIISSDRTNLSVIHAGTVPPNPSELLSHDRMKTLVETLKERYDYVLLDTPPVTVVTDAAILGRVVDGAVLVIRSRYAQTKTVQLAKQRLETVGVKLLGAVLTRFDMKKSGWRSGYEYRNYEYNYSENSGEDRKKS